MIQLSDIIKNNWDLSLGQVLYKYGEDVSVEKIIPGNFYSFDIIVDNINKIRLPNTIDEYKENPNSFLSPFQIYDLNPIGLVFYHDNISSKKRD